MDKAQYMDLMAETFGTQDLDYSTLSQEDIEADYAEVLKEEKKAETEARFLTLAWGEIPTSNGEHM